MERTFAWMVNYRRLLVRHERMLSVYEGFFARVCIMICLGELLK